MWRSGASPRRRILAAAAALAALTMFAAAAGARPAVSQFARPSAGAAMVRERAPTPPYRAPLPEPLTVRRQFEPPPTPYAAGHRGVDLAAAPRSVVRAAGAGRVSFAGAVGGRGVVVIRHPDGVRTEYEPIDASVHAGEPVALGQFIGTLRGAHGRCPADRCLHWGARMGAAYFDPLLLLRPLGPVRLLPWRRGIIAAALPCARWQAVRRTYARG